MDTLLFNPNAGTIKKMGLTTEQLTQKLASKGISAAMPPSDSPEEMLDAAVNAEGRVIVAGGDGTVHSLLQTVKKCNALKLAIIPCGTANHLANSLGIPQDVDAAIDVIAQGYSKQIDLGMANETIFSQAAGVGFHASVFHLYGERKDKSAMDAATAAATTLADWTPKLVRVIIDGEPYLEAVTQITAANTPMYGGRFMIAPDAKLDDGLLDIVIFGNMNKLEIIRYGVAAMTGSHVDMPKTYTTRAKRVEIAAVGEDPIDVHADAMPAGYTPAVIEVLPGCLDVIVPKENQ